MNMNEYNRTVAQDVLDAISGLERGDISVGDAQAVLQSAIPRFENDGSNIASAVRLAEGDLEEIQFTRLLSEQLPAAIFRLDELRIAIEEVTDG